MEARRHNQPTLQKLKRQDKQTNDARRSNRERILQGQEGLEFELDRELERKLAR